MQTMNDIWGLIGCPHSRQRELVDRYNKRNAGRAKIEIVEMQNTKRPGKGVPKMTLGYSDRDAKKLIREAGWKTEVINGKSFLTRGIVSAPKFLEHHK